jgi:hypothetical protein
MAECRSSGCGRKIDAWSDGNPFYIDETGKKQYAYHLDLQADWRNLERKSLKRDIYPRELIPGELQRSQTMELIPRGERTITPDFDIDLGGRLGESRFPF